MTRVAESIHADVEKAVPGTHHSATVNGIRMHDVLVAHEPIDCPTLAMWGADFDAVGMHFDVLDVWRSMTRTVRGVAIPHCYHLPREERPEVVNDELLHFLGGWRVDR